MAWNEVTALRRQRSRTYQDDSDPTKRALDCTMAALHYPSVLDSGVCDAELDMTPVRVDNAQLDGWRVTQNSWHYALGHPSDKPNDGWVGFGGRQGAHWFKFRLLRVGYMHWPTRAWDDIGGVPNYDRGNLTRTTSVVGLATVNDTVNVGTTATWADLWSTPGGGNITASWRASGTGLKELITLNQAGREWIAANRPPATPLAETYFGFVFQLDWSDIPKVVRNGIQQNVDGDFADDGEDIQLTDGLDRLLAFMPLNDVIVPSGLKGTPDTRQSLRKRFYSTGGNHYVLVGVRCDLLNGMPAGDLVFDPTVNEQVSSTNQDGHEDNDTTWLEDGYDSDGWRMGFLTNSFDPGFVFTTVAIPRDSTIDEAYIEIFAKYQNFTVIDVIFKGFDEDSAAVFASDGSNRPSTRDKTNATVSYGVDSNDVTDEQWYSFQSRADIKGIIEEIVARPGWSSGGNIGLVIEENEGAGADRAQFQDEGQATGYGAKLHVEYTAVGNPWNYYAQQ